MNINLRSLLITSALLLSVPMLTLTACSQDPATDGPSGEATTGAGAGTGEELEGICLLNNCSANEHCVGCPDGRDTCLVEENRCVACDPATGEGCPAGEECSPYGICVPDGLTCPTDDKGTPQVTCTKNADCKACSPMHQVCDTVTGTCQACTGTNTQHCLSSDICIDTDKDGRPETCSNKCPASCSVDNDCSQCGAPGNEAHACNAHKCAECSDTFPCAAGLECIQGVCTPPCGIPGGETGKCSENADCAFCVTDPNDKPWDCKYPVNGGNHGTCTPIANGCSDLGNQVAVLPQPYSDYTQLCSNDNDCSGVGIQFNVGEAIRDLVGAPEVNLGFTKVPIQDASITYGMNKCAAIELTNNISCGICVPCKQDSDCAPIPIDPLIADMFQGDPLATIAGALLIDLLWGDNTDHNINLFCQPVAFGYGACIPCANPLSSCGQGSSQGSGTCSHDTNTVGGALNNSCSQCADVVCQADSFCCDGTNGSWDQLCVDQAAQMCGSGPECMPSSSPMPSNQSSCTAAVCGVDPYCCNTAWDSICVSEAEQQSVCGC